MHGAPACLLRLPTQLMSELSEVSFFMHSAQGGMPGQEICLRHLACGHWPKWYSQLLVLYCCSPSYCPPLTLSLSPINNQCICEKMEAAAAGGCHHSLFPHKHTHYHQHHSLRIPPNCVKLRNDLWLTPCLLHKGARKLKGRSSVLPTPHIVKINRGVSGVSPDLEILIFNWNK